MKKIFTIVFLGFALTSYAQFSADFENGNLDGWTQAPEGRWDASIANAIAGNYSLKHTYNNSSSFTDVIYHPLSEMPMNSGVTQWRFLLRHGYNPSGSNRWAVFLFSNNPGSEWKSGGVYEGYAIGVRMVGTDNMITLYAVRNNSFSIVQKTSINWQEDIGTSGIGAIEVSRTASGEWSIMVATTGKFDDLQPVATPIIHDNYSTANYFGISYQYTQTADMLLWVDDIFISFTRVTVPTKISSAAQQGQNKIRVSFTQNIDAATAGEVTNYTFTHASATLSPVLAEAVNGKEILLTFENPLPRGNATLSVEKLVDENNNEVTDETPISIFYLFYGDVVINEIMASPAPSVGLPEVSYIELYNRLDVPVPLNGWKIEYNTTVGNIGAATISASGYLILCTSAAVEDMRTYGNATNVSYISSLTKSGKTLQLKNNEGLLLTRVTYSDQWFAEDAKRAGGWSLEKIDANNFSESAANWAESTDEKGGTPGQENSVQANRPDMEAPFVVALDTLDNQTLLLTFDELFDTTKAVNVRCYSLNNSVGHPQQAVISADNPQQVMLQFAQSFTLGVVYELTVSAPFCDLAGNEPDNLQYTFGNLFPPTANDIVINEVLFNPPTNGVDFIEIYNRSDKIFDLRQVKLGNHDKNNEVAALQSVSQQYFLHPGDYAVFTTDLGVVRQFYSVPFPEKVITLKTLPSYPNESGCVALLSDEEEIIDEFLYSENMHSGFISNPKGISLERVHPDRPSSESANWQSAAQDAGFATPTYQNSQDHRVNIKTAVLQGTDVLALSFTHAITLASATVTEHYRLEYTTGTFTPAQVEAISETQVNLFFASPLPRGEAEIKITGLVNEDNEEITAEAPISIFYLFYGDVVINEIMASSAPSVGLPEVSYIELYNRLDVPVPLNGWKIEYNATVGNIGAATIPADGYLILCTSTAVEDMRVYGNATNVSYISSLTKSGKTLQLKNNEGLLLARVTYSDQWFEEDAKRAGGWSLEKIDANNLSESAANWAESTDEKGGTPGQANSVQAHNPDTEAPFATSLDIPDNQTLLLTFNELFDTAKAANVLCYSLNNNAGHPQQAVISADNPQQVMLQFAQPFTPGVVYELTVSAPFCDLAGNVPDNLQYTFGNLFPPAANDIVISEVLFNPPTNGVDFVEIYNRSDKIFDLRQVKLGNRDKNNEVAALQSVLQQYFLHPGDYAVFTTDLGVVRQFYSVPFPEKVITLKTLPSYPNESGCVVLLSDEEEIIDEFLYSEKMHSGFISNPKGISLERVHPDRPGSESANWQSAAQDAGFATPTYRNSQYNSRKENAPGEFSLPYEVFSPDGDGYNDVLYIDYTLNAPGYVATITVYDVQGRLVKEVEKNALLGAAGRFAWDGTRHDGRKAGVGMYIIFIEYFDLNGTVTRLKKPCALAMR